MNRTNRIFLDSLGILIADGFVWVSATISIITYHSTESIPFTIAAMIFIGVLYLYLSYYSLKKNNNILPTKKVDIVLAYLMSCLILLLIYASYSFTFLPIIVTSIAIGIVSRELFIRSTILTNIQLAPIEAIQLNISTLISLASFLFISYIVKLDQAIDQAIMSVLVIRLTLHYLSQLQRVTRSPSIFELINVLASFYRSELYSSQYYKKDIKGLWRFMPFMHYLLIGHHMGMKPSSNFSIGDYIQKNDDIKSYDGLMICHAIRHGIQEGRIRKNKVIKNYGNPIYKLPMAHKSVEVSWLLHVHLYYMAEAKCIVKKLSIMDIPLNVIVTLAKGSKIKIRDIESSLKSIKHINSLQVITVPNKGRDLLPLIMLINENSINSELICHIHTKRSPHLNFGNEWFLYMLNEVFGSNLRVRKILTAFEKNKDIGILCPKYFNKIPGQPNCGQNRQQLEFFLKFSHYDQMPLVFQPSEMNL